LKVLLVSSTSLFSGTGRRVANFAEGLRELGHSASVLVPPEGKKESTHVARDNGFLGRDNGWSREHFLVRGANSLITIPDRLGRVLDDYDVIHIFATALPHQATLAICARLFNRSSKLVVDWDDMWGFDVPRNNSTSLISSWVLRTLQYSTCSKSDGLCVVSPALRDFAERIGISREKTFVVPNACQIDKITPGDKESSRSLLNLDDYPMVVVIGYPYANGVYTNAFRLLFEALAEVMKVLPHVRLLMVGNRIVPRSLEPSYERIRNSLIQVGSVPFSAITSYLRSADVLYFPMDPTVVNDYYRWPIRFCDYLASGRPIVSNAIGAVRRVMTEEDCAIVTKSNPKEIAKGILRVLQNKSLADKIGARAKETAEKYSTARIARRAEETYRSIFRF
jgi:glycosyltransferase involved in cell wall biosynthesis